jgi:hypothetical protein
MLHNDEFEDISLSVQGLQLKIAVKLNVKEHFVYDSIVLLGCDAMWTHR